MVEPTKYFSECTTAVFALGPQRSHIQESNAVPLFEATAVSKVALQLRLSHGEAALLQRTQQLPQISFRVDK